MCVSVKKSSLSTLKATHENWPQRQLRVEKNIGEMSIRHKAKHSSTALWPVLHAKILAIVESD